MDKAKNLSKWLFFALLAYMPLHILLSTWIGSTLGILDIAKVFKDIILIFGFLLAVAVSSKQPWFTSFLKDKLVWCIAAYAGLTVLLALIKPTDTDAEILGIVYNLRFFIFFLYAGLLIRLYDAKELRRTARRIVLLVAVPVMLFGVAQYLFLPDGVLTHVGYSRQNGVLPAFFIDDKPDLERVMSTLRDPNSFGSYIIIILSFVFVLLLRIKDKNLRQILVGVLMLGILSLLFTFSRSAWIGMTVACLVLAGLYIRHKQSFRITKKFALVSASLVLIFVLIIIPFRNSYIVKNTIFHADESTVLEDPNELRTRFWQESFKASAEEPLGYGPGTAGLASIRNDQQGTVLNENYYLQILHEVGIIGLILFSTILIIVLRRLYSVGENDGYDLALFAALLGLCITNLFVHIWSNEAVAFTFWGLAGLLLMNQHYNKRQS